MVIMTFLVDSTEYLSTANDNVMVIKEYTYGKNRITQQTVQEATMKQIAQKLHFTEDVRFDRERYFYIDLETQNRTEISCMIYSDLLSRFPPNGLRISEKYCELYDYPDQHNQRAKAWITVSKEEDTPMQAKIEFRTAGDAENFVLPGWLRPAEQL